MVLAKVLITPFDEILLRVACFTSCCSYGRFHSFSPKASTRDSDTLHRRCVELISYIMHTTLCTKLKHYFRDTENTLCVFAVYFIDFDSISPLCGEYAGTCILFYRFYHYYRYYYFFLLLRLSTAIRSMVHVKFGLALFQQYSLLYVMTLDLEYEYFYCWKTCQNVCDVRNIITQS